MGFLEKGAWLLFVIFFALKIAGVTEMGWLGVFAPLLLNYSLFVVTLVWLWIIAAINRRKNRPWYEKL